MFELKISGITEAKLLAPISTKIVGLLNPGDPVQINHPFYHTEWFHDLSFVHKSEDVIWDSNSERTIDEIEAKFNNEWVAPRRPQIERILEFSSNFSDDDKVLVHCSAGVSRSTATAIAIMIQHGLTPEVAFDECFRIRGPMNPNTIVLGLADNILNLKGELIKYYNFWKNEKCVNPENFAGQASYQGVNDMKDILSKIKF